MYTRPLRTLFLSITAWPSMRLTSGTSGGGSMAFSSGQMRGRSVNTNPPPESRGDESSNSAAALSSRPAEPIAADTPLEQPHTQLAAKHNTQHAAGTTVSNDQINGSSSGKKHVCSKILLNFKHQIVEGDELHTTL